MAPTLEKLPLELLQLILEHISINNIRSAISSCQAMWYAYKAARGLILSATLIPAETLPDALAVAHLHRRLVTQDIKTSVERYFDRAQYEKMVAEHRYSLSEAELAGDFQHTAYLLALDFVRDTLVRHPLNGPKLEESTRPSSLELIRICRALLRFEVSCLLFGRNSMPAEKGDWARQQFITRYAPWENEQLVCVQGYLFRAISPGL